MTNWTSWLLILCISSTICAGSRPANGSSRPKSMLEELMKRDLAKKKASATSAAASQAQNRQPGRTDLPWVAKGIIVKVGEGQQHVE